MRRQQAVRIAGSYWVLRQHIKEEQRQGAQVKPAIFVRLRRLEEQLCRFLHERYKQEDRLGEYLVLMPKMHWQGEDRLEIVQIAPPEVR